MEILAAEDMYCIVVMRTRARKINEGIKLKLVATLMRSKRAAAAYSIGCMFIHQSVILSPLASFGCLKYSFQVF